MLMVTWDKPDMPGSSEITGYSVHFRQIGGVWTMNPAGDDPLERMAMIMGLANGVEHEVQVFAMNEAGRLTVRAPRSCRAPPMEDAGGTPTPALPIFGAVALGAGLLAAGRARLHNRRQLSAVACSGSCPARW